MNHHKVVWGTQVASPEFYYSHQSLPLRLSPILVRVPPFLLFSRVMAPRRRILRVNPTSSTKEVGANCGGVPSTSGASPSHPRSLQLVVYRVVHGLWEAFQIPADFDIILLTIDDSLWSHPPHSIRVPIESFQAAFRLPIHHFFESILHHYGRYPGDLSLNSWHILCGFIFVCNQALVSPNVFLFW